MTDLRLHRELAALCQLRRWPEVLDRATRALGADPDDVDLRCYGCQALLALDRGKEALRWAQRAVALGPEDEWAHRLLASSLGANRRFREAVATAEQAVRLDPHRSPARYLLVRMLLQGAGVEGGGTRRRWRAQAGVHANELVRMFPTTPEAHLARAWVHLADKQVDQAEADARTALQIDPTIPEGHELLGHIARQRGEVARAADHYLAAGRADPSDDAPGEHLRSLTRVGIPFGLTIWLVVRALKAAGLLSGGAMVALLVLLGIAAAVASAAVQRSRLARLSPEALQAIELDRALRSRRERTRDAARRALQPTTSRRTLALAGIFIGVVLAATVAYAVLQPSSS